MKTNADRVGGRSPGSAYGVATLDANTLVVQDPANATATPAANKIVKYDSGGDIPIAAFPAGTVVQVVATTISTEDSTATTIPADDTIPQNTEGKEYITLAITPKAASNKLIIEFTGYGTTTTTGYVSLALFQDTTANALAASTVVIVSNNSEAPLILRHSMVAGTTSSTTFKIRFGPSANTAYMMSANTRSLFGGVNVATFTITEYVA